MDKKQFLTLRQLCAAALGAALIAICTWISIPGTVPFTMQTFAICLLAGLLGLKCGMLSLIVYLLLGFVGLPVFSGFRGGLGVLLGPTGGYLIGFLFTVPAVGLISGRFGKKFWTLIAAMVVGCLLYYLFGSLWYLLLYLDGPGAFATVLMTCVVPFLLPDALKILLAAVLVGRLKDHVRL